MEMDDQEFLKIKDFITNDLDIFDWENAPEDMVSKYAEVIQVVNSYGPDDGQGTGTGTTGTAAAPS